MLSSKTHNKTCHTQIISIVVIAVYIIVGILFYRSEEGWSIIDCIYFCMVIVTTVGYGDLTPSTDRSKAFTIGFALFGIAVIGIALGHLAESFIERRKATQHAANAKILQQAGDAASHVASTKGRPPTPKNQKDVIKDHTSYKYCRFSESIQAALTACTPIVVSITCGMVIGYLEGWSFLDSLYTTILTVTTIGFGDLSPSTENSRLFAIVYLPLAVISVANAIGTLSALFSKKKMSSSDSISMKELIAMDKDGDGAVSETEYLSYMLLKLNMARKEDVHEILSQFHKLDADGSGFLDRSDLERLDEQLHRTSHG